MCSAFFLYFSPTKIIYGFVELIHDTLTDFFSDFLFLYSFALTALDCTIPAASIVFISAGVKPYSSRTSTVCSPTTGSGFRQGSAGDWDRTGAGRGNSSPLESLMKEFLSWLWGCELTWSKDNTGVTQASVPSNIFVQSACVFEAKRSAKILLSSGQSLKLFWSGRSLVSNSKPVKGRGKKNRLMMQRRNKCVNI